mgnify:FL=1
MKLFTIGFSGKSAEEFFTLLTQNSVKKLIDIRLNNSSQLSGFTNIKHLPYFLKLHNIEYDYKPIFAPTKELLSSYKDKKTSWQEYEKIYIETLKKRDVLKFIDIADFQDSVFLCSEATANMCHRRLLAEYVKSYFDTITIKHL